MKVVLSLFPLLAGAAGRPSMVEQDVRPWMVGKGAVPFIRILWADGLVPGYKVVEPSLTPLSPTPLRDEGMEVEGEVVRQTRSGKAFGVWQDRKRRLRQEAIDDPDE